jgi:hypothetical protein
MIGSMMGSAAGGYGDGMALLSALTLNTNRTGHRFAIRNILCPELTR